MELNNTKQFGMNLKILRKQMGVTQQRMANTLNTSRSCISNYESGNRQPDNETIRHIADYFDVSVDYLLGRSTIKTVIKNDEDMFDIQKAISRVNLCDKLDVRCAPAHIKCALLEFYIYLTKKEGMQKK